jgi:cytochrome c oxidase assembly protein subunit 15
LPFAALTAIHMAHRLGALVVFVAMGVLAALLWRCRDQASRRWALAVVGVALWQFGTGLSNVVLGWPLLAALGHTAGAAAMVVGLSVLLARAHHARRADLVPVAAGAPASVTGSAPSALGQSA